MFFSQYLVRARMFYAVPDKVSALRVHKLLPVPGTTDPLKNRERTINEVATRLNDPDWTALSAAPNPKTPPEIAGLVSVMAAATQAGKTLIESSMAAVGGLPKVATEQPRLFEGGDAQRAPSARSGAKAEKTAQNGKSAPVSMPWDMGSTMGQEELSQRTDVDMSEVVGFESFGMEGAAQGGFVPHDLDTNVIPRVEVEGEGEDITKLKLPDDMAAYIEGMADKFNKGLGSDADKAK
jgi:hypothetical protein